MPASSPRRASSTYVGLEQSAAHSLTLHYLLLFTHSSRQDLTIATRLYAAAKCLSFVAYSRYRTPQLGWYWTFPSLGESLQPCVIRYTGYHRGNARCTVSWNLVNCCTAVQKITFQRLAVGMTLNVTQGHRKCLYLTGHISLPISGLW